MTDGDYETLLSITGGVSRETFDKLKSLQALLTKWNSSINLVAPSTEREIWTRHILDSVQLAKIAPGDARWLDLGSGGGFPGLVMAILLGDRPSGYIHLVESNRKKAGFLQFMVGQLALPARVHAVRIEDMVRLTTDIVTARALASLPKLLELAEFWLISGARGLFHKGRDYEREISESAQLWSFDLLRHASVIDTDSVILEISNLRRR